MITQMSRKILWICPDEPGFMQYSQDLVSAINGLSQGPAVCAKVRRNWSKREKSNEFEEILSLIRTENPALVHFQHEYGLFGSKVPFLYRFPKLIALIRNEFPSLKIVATAHMIIDENYRYPLEGKGLQVPFRWMANQFGLPRLLKLWNEKTWGVLDGIVVHSKHQIPFMKKVGCKFVAEIPQYVPASFNESAASPGPEPAWKKKIENWLKNKEKFAIIFGYVTPEKGQDVALKALPYTKEKINLVLAGRVGKGSDAYQDECNALISENQLEDRVTQTGFVSFQQLQWLCEKTAFAIIPFRFTANSGSLVDLIAKGTPLLASDLPLNLEINERVPGLLDYFRSEDPEDCARKIDFWTREEKLRELKTPLLLEYARLFSAPEMARKHCEFYQEIGL
jgi:glycosyltransferase involved in cell wall biosynthesis